MSELFCTCIIPTVGRETLDKAVASVLAQSLPEADYEIIVINDSGAPLLNRAWQESDKVQIIDTNRRERSVARNTGAAIARGHFLHFLDDDDWIANEAYRQLRELHRTTEAKWLYGTTQLLDRNHETTIRLKHDLRGNCFVHAMAGEWIPLQASLVDRILFWKVGGFDITLSGPEDIDLQRRMFLETDISGTPNLVAYVVRGEEGSTTDYQRHSYQSRQAREGILDSKKTFRRIRDSARDSRWQGHMTRVYLTSVVWNLQRCRFLKAIDRLAHWLTCLALAGLHLFTRQYWSSVFRPYQSVTFERGIREAQAIKKDSA